MARPAVNVERASSRNLRVLGRLAGLALTHRAMVALAVAALVVAAAMLLTFGRGLGWLIDEGFARGAGVRLDWALAGLFLVVAVLACATFLRAWSVAWLGERLAASLRRDAFAHLTRLTPAFYETQRTGELLSRLSADTAVVQTVLTSSASMAARNVLLVLGGIAMMIASSPRLAAMALAIVPVVVVPAIVLGRRVRALSRESQRRVGEVGAEAEEAIVAIRTVQGFGQERRTLTGFEARLEAAVAAALGLARARAGLAAIVILLVFGAVGVVLWLGGHDVLAGRISAGALASFVFYAVIVASAVGSLSEFAADLQRAAGAAERLFEIIDARPAIVAPTAPMVLPTPSRGAVVFEQVTFRYPTRAETTALDSLSFAAEAGVTTALVGPSGAGKSTVFQLLLRFYDPSAGTVRFDGVDITTLDSAALRARIALVPQEPVIFAADVAANIRFGRPDASEAELRHAAEAAQAAEFIERLPERYATMLGERGQLLSVGQKQRIAIARAILRDPALLLLDEATSALDSESERLVQKAIEDLAQNRTTLVIAHRLATVQRAARLLVLDRGRLVETGTHAELVQRDGLYAHLARLQFDGRS
jgi:ATP-binding cassette subfamily B protein